MAARVGQRGDAHLPPVGEQRRADQRRLRRDRDPHRLDRDQDEDQRVAHVRRDVDQGGEHAGPTYIVPAPMAIGILTGSGTYALPGVGEHRAAAGGTRHSSGPGRSSRAARGPASTCSTSRATARVTRGTVQSRRAPRKHRGVAWTLGATGVPGGDGVRRGRPRRRELGSLVCFDDLHFLSNRLPDGSSLHVLHGCWSAAKRGHWIYEGPFSTPLRAALLAGGAGGGRGRARRRLLRP